jgi:ABC-type multidrug transport system fused ATPase/permease subunit
VTLPETENGLNYARISLRGGHDEILILDGGRIVERGTHGEPVKVNGLYARMVGGQDRMLAGG